MNFFRRLTSGTKKDGISDAGSSNETNSTVQESVAERLRKLLTQGEKSGSSATEILDDKTMSQALSDIHNIPQAHTSNIWTAASAAVRDNFRNAGAAEVGRRIPLSTSFVDGSEQEVFDTLMEHAVTDHKQLPCTWARACFYARAVNAVKRNEESSGVLGNEWFDSAESGHRDWEKDGRSYRKYYGPGWVIDVDVLDESQERLTGGK